MCPCYTVLSSGQDSNSQFDSKASTLTNYGIRLPLTQDWSDQKKQTNKKKTPPPQSDRKPKLPSVDQFHGKDRASEGLGENADERGKQHLVPSDPGTTELYGWAPPPETTV